MEIYLVGGAVRDGLLGLPVTERDWVVVGATPGEMLAQGYKQVGRDFPVFLHPETGEEYALARTERKSGRGHVAFECNSDPTVTLEQDLLRRDLTINAIAKDSNGNLIDPHGGREDLRRKCLRHVSGAFVEDPLRVLRVARFAARFGARSDIPAEYFDADPSAPSAVHTDVHCFDACGFTVHPDTVALMTEIAQSGELELLPQERVWQELGRALGERAPGAFFDTLMDCGAMAHLLPELAAHTQPFWHRYRRKLYLYLEKKQQGRWQRLNRMWQRVRRWLQWPWQALDTESLADASPEIRFAVLLSRLDASAARALCERLRPPRRFADLALLCCKHRDTFQNAPGRLSDGTKQTAKGAKQTTEGAKQPAKGIEQTAKGAKQITDGTEQTADGTKQTAKGAKQPADGAEQPAEAIMQLLEHADALRRPERFADFLRACALAFPQAAANEGWLHQAARRCAAVDIDALKAEGISGAKLGQRLRERRVAAIAGFMAENA